MAAVQTNIPSISVPNHRGVLRFITAGSVDDGKSTLIGRLLFDSQAILADQLNALENAKQRHGLQDQVDLSLLTDGLEAEREQGITIDVAYRYFSTANRKFIIADAPGHEQYTRNMVTGASNADAALILIDPTRVKDGKLLTQTKRHSRLLSLLGVKHIAVIVNKMDLVDYSEAVFEGIVTAYTQLAQLTGIDSFTPIPLSALSGDNVVHASAHMPWWKGLTLIEWLHKQPNILQETTAGLRLPVQLVIRTEGQARQDFRGYAGRIAAGSISKGDKVQLQPAGLDAVVSEVLSAGKSVQQACLGEAVTVRLDRHLDISRGDMICAHPDTQAQLLTPNPHLLPLMASVIDADLCWFDKEPLQASRKYLLRNGTREVAVKLRALNEVLDLETLMPYSHKSIANTLKMNDIARVQLQLQAPLVFDPYDICHETGAFVIIDPVSHGTLAAGMIRAAL